MRRRLSPLWLFLALAAAGAASAQPYKRTPMKNADLCIYWQDRQYTYQLAQAGYSQLSFSSMEAAVQASFATWQTLSQSCSGYQFNEGPTVANAQVGYDPFGQNSNVVIFRESACANVVPPGDPCLAVANNGPTSCNNMYSCWDYPEEIIALTTVTYDVDAGIIYDADIEINAGPDGTGVNRLFTVVSSPQCTMGNVSTNCVATDLQNTLTHEIGHVIGLAHVDGGNSTMFATANIGETAKRVIDFGTGSGFCGIYPANGPSTPSCDLSTQAEAITATNQGTPQVACTLSGGGASLWSWAGVGLCALMLRRRFKKNGARRAP
jgi:hypothetical protein